MDDFETTFEVIPPEIRDLIVRVQFKAPPDRRLCSVDIRPLTKLSYEHLEQQLETTPSIFAFWGMLLAEQKMAVAFYELRLRKRKAELADGILQRAQQDGIQLRRSDISDMIECDQEYVKLKLKMILEEKTLHKLEILLEAIKMKGEHLRSLAGFKKQELANA